MFSSLDSRPLLRMLVFVQLLLVLSTLVLGFELHSVQQSNTLISERQLVPKGQCSNSVPCADGSCCNGITFFCGLDPQHCDPSACISNCNATAECGVGAKIPGATCPLNVCCSPYGYCGVTSEFCGNGCQSNCKQPASTGLSDGNVQNLVIGYFEAWNLITPTCAQVDLSFIPTDSLTHLNVAFGYIQPDTYTVYPMPGAGIAQFQQLTNLKQGAPGLRVWLSLGGWDYSDNGTTTQPVFSDLASTVQKRAKFIASLASFMTEWGFDGVDIDWEYPGAPDRNGKPEDTHNYVLLLQDMQTYFQLQNTGWGISFTAPTSYWYLQWFDIGNMTLYADWVNLMTYDLHGSWDSASDDIGSYVFAHTNLTEIESALDLFWRNSVPASMINLGLGFYGRTYTLADTSCYKPGCAFSDPGVAGACTGTAGFMSYHEISEMMEIYNYKPYYDQVAGVNYMVFDNDQWVSFDDERSIMQKVKFANDQGSGDGVLFWSVSASFPVPPANQTPTASLLGLFIWAIDEDTPAHTLLNATLWPPGLGKFQGQTGSGFTDTSNYTNIDVSQCTWTDCGTSTTPQCGVNTQLLTTVRCSLAASGSVQYRSLCCPFGNTPDPAFCTWRAGSNAKSGFCSPGCNNGEIPFATSSWAEIDGGNVRCFSGYASYCCQAVETGSSVCGWNPICTTLDSNDKPTDSNACPVGRDFITYAASGAGYICDGDSGNPNTWLSFCCDSGITPKYEWAGSGGAPNFCDDNTNCPNGYIGMGLMNEGEGQNCEFESAPTLTGSGYPIYEGRTLCVDASVLSLTVNNLPVPLKNLFPTPGPSSDKQSWDVKLDPSMGGTDPVPNGSTDPDQNSFGWHIMSGPADEITTMNKRDGSHWDVYDCEHAGEERQTVKTVCTDEYASSKCGIIFTGRGVAETVVEMPPGCGAGKYAMAVSLEPAANQTLPHRLVKRGLKNPLVYDFTFDYDFTPLQRRQSESNVLLRIDYSDDPGYWNQIVAAAPKHRRKSKREMENLAEIVRREHGGSWKRFMEHEFREDKLSTPEDEMHLLHERWFSADLADWLSKMYTIDQDYDLFRHSVNQQLRWFLFQDSITCTLFGIPADAYFAAWADLNIDIETSAQLTLIGNLGDLSSFQESYLLVRNSGSVKASLNIEALGTLKFTTGRIELVGAEQFGGTFGIPGLVTIGPNFQIFGELSGTATLHAEARVDFNIYNWDYTQQYPNVADDEPPLEQDTALVTHSVAGAEDAKESGPTFYYDVGAEGQLTIAITPQASFGITWNNQNVPDTTVALGVETSLTVYGRVGSNTNNPFYYCYGADIDVQVYASVSAPAIFHVTNKWIMYAPNGAIHVIDETCSAAESSLQVDGVMNTWDQLDAGN